MNTSAVFDKLEALRRAEEELNEEICLAHNVNDEEDEVMLTWDEQRDFEYLYDRMDLFAALHSLLEAEDIDVAARQQMLDVLTADVNDVINERLADIAKANTVIADMKELLSACETAKDELA